VRPFYRIRQFLRALVAAPPSGAPPELGPGLRELFVAMSPADRSHALRARAGLAGEAAPPDLVVAALLHDVGKSGAPIHLWDRAIFVLAERFFPRWLDRLAGRDGLPFGAGLVALQRHARLGAQWVAAAGGSPRLVDLIRYHHTDPATLGWQDGERQLLEALQRADEQA